MSTTIQAPRKPLVLAICLRNGHALAAPDCPRCYCGGTVRLLAQPVTMEHYRRLRESGEWQDLKTVRVR